MIDPLVSIIIPVYNKEKYLNESISSAISQSYKQIEVIIINDGSTDGSEHIIEKWTKNDNRITYVKQENKGVSFARNLGIDLSKGEFIFFLDADDKIDKNAISDLINKTNGNRYDIIVANFIRVYSDKQVKKDSQLEKHYSREQLDDVQIKSKMFLYKGRLLATACNKLYRREFLFENKIRFCKNVLAEDRLFNLVCYVHGPEIFVTNIYSYYYNIIDESRSRSYSPNQHMYIIELYNVLDNYLNKKNYKIDLDELKVVNIIYDIDNIINYEYNLGKRSIGEVSKILEVFYYNKVINTAIMSVESKKLFKQLESTKTHLFRMKFFFNLLKRKKFKTLSAVAIFHRKLIK